MICRPNVVGSLIITLLVMLYTLVAMVGGCQGHWYTAIGCGGYALFLLTLAIDLWRHL